MKKKRDIKFCDIIIEYNDVIIIFSFDKEIFFLLKLKLDNFTAYRWKYFK